MYALHTPPLSASSSAASTPGNPSKRKPNILFILADQVSAPLLRIHNEASPIKTPHIDALAAKSAVFASAYCASPLCAPSRSSLVTGQLPTRISAWDNASPLGCDVPTYAHYLRREGYETVLAGKMHFIGEQLHGYEERLTSDIYPGDFGWAVNWDEPDRRLEWYHNASSILQAGPCIRSNQLDFDEEVMFKSTRYLYATARRPPSARPFCLTVSLTHPHDPYTIHNEYWDRYEGVDIPMPEVNIPTEEQDAHSRRLLKVCGLLDEDIPDEAIKRARRAYFGAMSYVDDNVGKLLQVLKDCGMDDNTIVIFSADHGDMLGERGLWYKMSFHEGSARVPLMIFDPRQIAPNVIHKNVSNIDILPTLVDLVNGSLDIRLPMDGNSLVPYLNGRAKGLPNYDTVYGEYCGEGTVAPLMMIRSGDWKLVVCPADPPQFFNVKCDPHELHNLATSSDSAVQETFQHFLIMAKHRWNFDAIHNEVLKSQRTRRLCWDALKEGRFESWDYQPREDAGNKYIRSTMPLDDLELQARYPPVDSMGREKPRGQAKGIAAAWGE
ncbi:hypothetical protein JMJ35_010491 [Cladonia borealis]|uniref:Choline-sulfatase n=1 Tax=Cladonia borealis TaxID=184061 RepID=A0AA39QQ25_9LECA|nr:hypothetical protein JMJ35_010491 [Cladonia borealis]